MGFENSAGLSVYNHYGPRVTEAENSGSLKTYGAEQEIVIEVTGEQINDIITNGTSRSMAINKLPSGAKILEAYVDVETAFTITGTTPTLQVGTEGSEGTNYFAVSETQLENAGVYKITSFNGTWANELAADTQVGFAITGGGALADTGRGRIVIRFAKVK